MSPREKQLERALAALLDGPHRPAPEQSGRERLTLRPTVAAVRRALALLNEGTA